MPLKLNHTTSCWLGRALYYVERGRIGTHQIWARRQLQLCTDDCTLRQRQGTNRKKLGKKRWRQPTSVKLNPASRLTHTTTVLLLNYTMLIAPPYVLESSKQADMAALTLPS